MDKYQIDQKKKRVTIKKNHFKLQKLYRMLTYESSLILMLAGIPFLGVGLVLMILNIMAIVFIPLMIKTLFQMKKFGWLISFIVVTIAPRLLMLLYRGNYSYYLIFSSIGMFNFVAYCWIFKFVVKEWLDEYLEDDFEAEHEFEYEGPGF